MTLGALAFTSPWILLAFLALPILWIILRAVPPAPIRRLFPAVGLLIGLRDDDSVSDRTPWWLLLLRSLAAALVILGLAGPVLNPEQNATQGDGPLLVILDGGWASADDWSERMASVDNLLAEAGRSGRTVAVLQLSSPEALVFLSASNWRSRIAGISPTPWGPTKAMMTETAHNLEKLESFETVWFSDGLERDGRFELLGDLRRKGPVSVVEGTVDVLALHSPEFEDGLIKISAARANPLLERDVLVQTHGRDPAGIERVLAELPMRFDTGETQAEAELALPGELRGRITRFSIRGLQGAGTVVLSDDRLSRREVALVSVRQNREGLELLSPLHYLRNALETSTDLLEGSLETVLPGNPHVIILADIAELSPIEEEALQTWVEEGGVLVRFAGPRVAASEISRREEHPLMPVRLRTGGRTVGGAMSWGEPKKIAPFDQDSPFSGLDIPDDVVVSAQVMAQPDPVLSERSIARLSDGTPLVTRKPIGAGNVVLFHVTANAEWSTLPLSGLFVNMLERLSVSTPSTSPDAADMEGRIWQPLRVIDGFGMILDGADLPGVDGTDLVNAPLGPELRPGLYQSGSRQTSRNVLAASETLDKASWPADISIKSMEPGVERLLGGWLLAGALLLLFADILASLWLSGRLFAARTAGLTALAIGLAAAPDPSFANDEMAIDATADVVLAHVLTGNKAVDDTARAGLLGLSETLYFRTSVEPSSPMGANLETDELAFFPLLYWPITPDQPQPSKAAYEKLNRYLRTGGMILFDTRDADIAGFGAASPNGRKLQQLAAPLNIPPLEPVPSDHVLTRTFYLLQEFPGRHTSNDIWVEAAPPDAEKIEGMPFRNLNDGVTPVVIGGNDWAAAWAMDARGNPVFPVGRGLAGERQRELAFRFGVNLVMHVLTGNYKSDQVHVPALLERLGQ